jgi:glycosyltransferase involved in cell wall biosynthesis
LRKGCHGKCIKQRGADLILTCSKVAIPDNRTSVVLPPTPVLSAAPRPKLLFLVTEDWYFWSHRLPVARAARAAGFAVVVATRVRAHGERIRAEGFAVRALRWRRCGDGLIGACRAISEIARLYRAEQPDLVHHVALKPVLFGGLATRLTFGRSSGVPAVINAIMGFGSGFSRTNLSARLRRRLLGLCLRVAADRRRARMVVQNPEDRAALAKTGIDPDRIALIRGSGVDLDHFLPLPDPDTPILAAALVSRMLREKGVIDAVAAIRMLRDRGLPIELLLAGPTDPDNPGSLTSEMLTSLSKTPGITWLGPVADVRAVWRRAAIALLPSTYGEGVPKALLEAAACARPIVATDVPGCREVVHSGQTGILVPPRDIDQLAKAIAELAGDPALRARMGRAGRSMIQKDFGEQRVARETLDIYQTALRERTTTR